MVDNEAWANADWAGMKSEDAAIDRDYEMDHESGSANAQSPPRMREWFPETLLWKPELITNEAGVATLDIALADSITTWQMDVAAVFHTRDARRYTDKNQSLSTLLH